MRHRLRVELLAAVGGAPLDAQSIDPQAGAPLALRDEPALVDARPDAEQGSVEELVTGDRGGASASADRQNDRWLNSKQGAGWSLIGKQVVNFKDDRDRISVGDSGRHNGRFKELQIRAEGAPIEIRRMVVRFDNNETMDAISKRTRLDENSGISVDLPGHRRDIKDIDIDYFSVDKREGRGTLLVYAR